MKDEDKIKDRLINELVEMRHRVTELEVLEAERKRAEEYLKKYQFMVESASDAIFFKDLKSRYVIANAKTLDAFGLSREEVIGKNDYELMSNREEAGKNVEDDQLIFKTGKSTEITKHMTRADGKECWFHAIKVPHFDDKGNVTGLVGIARGITERKWVEEALIKKTEELERSNKELEEFANIVAHDLQEPLRMVAFYVQLLVRRYKGKLGADADELIAYAVDGATWMQELVNALLAYSRVTTGGKSFVPTDCEAVLERILANLQVVIEESGAVVTYDPLPTVVADASQLAQLFQNLIGNAIKFRREDPPRVHVSAKQKGNEWIFSVYDNGIGIDPKYAEDIFKIFYRLHRRGKYPGTGMGLAICKKIVGRHGGQIWVESQLGKGTIFYFTTPIKEAEQP